MPIDSDITDILKSGSTEEIGRAITDLARLKDPQNQEDLRRIMRGHDQYLAAMAAYALGESGDPAGMEYLKNLLQSVPTAFNPTNASADLNALLEEIHKLHDSIDNALSLYNRSYCIQAKEKLLDLLKVYSAEIPLQNVPHFDKLVSFSVKKSRGLLLDALAICEFNLGNVAEALHYSMEAVTLGQETGDPQLLKLAYADLGHIHISLGNYYSALELLHLSLDIDDTSHDPWRKRNRTVSNLARLYYVIGMPEKALEYIQEALELAEKEQDIVGTAKNLNTAGVLLTGSGSYADAESCLQRAKDLAVEELKDKSFEGLVLNNLAYLNYEQQDIDSASIHLQSALAISREMSDRTTEIAILTNMAVVELELVNQEADKAEDIYREGAKDAKETNDKEVFQPSSRPGGSNVSGSEPKVITFDADSQSRAEQAVYREGAKDAKETKDDVILEPSSRSSRLRGSSVSDSDLPSSDHYEEAERLASNALDISREIEDVSGQIDALWILGSIAAHIHEDHEKAYCNYKEAIGLSESLRKNLMLDDFKISFAGNHIGMYQQMVSLCVSMGKTKEAFQYIERSKSRALVDMLAGSSNQISPKSLTEEKLKKFDSLRGKLDLLKKRMSTSAGSPFKNEAERSSRSNELQELEKGYTRTFDELKIQDPKWASLVSVDAADLRTVQSVLDQETLLLEFYQAGTETFILAIKNEGEPTVHRMVIDAEAEANRVYALFEAISEGKNTDTRSHEYIKKVKQPLSYFHELLIAPFAEQLSGIKHIVIVPHYFWHYLPFQALYDGETKQYLIDKFSISYSPSATALTFYREGAKDAKETNDKDVFKPSSRSSRLGGSNVFGSDVIDLNRRKEVACGNSEAESSGVGPPRDLRALAVNGVDVRSASILKNSRYTSIVVLANPTGDLRFSEEEGKAIAEKFDNPEIFVKDEATFDKLKDHSKCDVIHLACHGYFRGDAPLFSHVLLSDSKGESTPVYLSDLFNLKLDTSLVTLSACDTGVSRFTSGDELIGLSRAFMYAGSPSIVSSLWTVNDESTALIMNRFYDGFVQFGESKSEALRQAALNIKSLPAYGHPCYWASFFLAGHWK